MHVGDRMIEMCLWVCWRPEICRAMVISPTLVNSRIVSILETGFSVCDLEWQGCRKP
jgi:hypothetical protein